MHRFFYLSDSFFSLSFLLMASDSSTFYLSDPFFLGFYALEITLLQRLGCSGDTPSLLTSLLTVASFERRSIDLMQRFDLSFQTTLHKTAEYDSKISDTICRFKGKGKNNYECCYIHITNKKKLHKCIAELMPSTSIFDLSFI